MDLCGFAVFQFSMDLCAFSYVMLRAKLRMYVSSLPYSTNFTYNKGIYFILFFAGTGIKPMSIRFFLPNLPDLNLL